MNLICGINPVLEALNAGARPIDRLLVVKGLRNPRVSDAMARASQRGIPLRFEARETLDRMAGGVPHQGVIALVSAKPTIDLDSLLEHAREPALLVVLDGVEDPRNLGAILRTAEAAGADGVVLTERHSAGLSETVSRSSAGALEYVRVARVGNLSQAIEELKRKGLWVIGFDAAGGERWDAVDYRRPAALVFGGEGRGIRRLVKEHCDQVVSIPLFGHITSLNVSVAAGVALFEVIRQRGVVPSHVRPIPARHAPPARQIVGPAPEDVEHDPGLVAPSFQQQPESPEDDEIEDPIGLVRLPDEESAWRHSSPTPIPSSPSNRGQANRGQPSKSEPFRPRAGGEQPGGKGSQASDQDRRQQRRFKDRAAQRPPETRHLPPSLPAQGDDALHGRRRKKRRRHRLPPDRVPFSGGGPPGREGSAAAPVPTEGSGPGRQPEVQGAPRAPGDPPAAPGARRRRRRRHRH